MTDHIKMPNVTPIVRYVADGYQNTYSYPFPIFIEDDLKIYIDGALQSYGYTISGAGETNGGSVTFDTAPADESIITIERKLLLQRTTDYLESGDFSAASINNELDYLIAGLQQLQRQNATMLKYSDHENPANIELPIKKKRAGKALGFDAQGNPIAIPLNAATAATEFTAQGIGAQTRSVNDKLSDFVSIKDFGAIGDGLIDDTIAIQQALAAHKAVLIPEGTYLITNTISLKMGQSIIGVGRASTIKASTNSFIAIEIPVGSTTLQNLRIEGGDVGIKLLGKTSECTQNNLRSLEVVGSNTGLQLDGYEDKEKPCYWNNFDNILIEAPLTNGVHMIKSGNGDTPNANRFHRVRVYSKGARTSGSGFYIEAGALNNSFIDCEANVNGDSAKSCFRVGSGSDKTLIVNLLTESNNLVPNLQLDAGSTETSIINLSAQSNGAAILDYSDGDYDAINAGYPNKNTMRKTAITDLTTTLTRRDTEFIDTVGSHALDLSHTIHIVNATNGAIDIQLPNAGDAVGVEMTIKKVDDTSNIVTVTESEGDGADGKTIQLGGANDYVTVLSNGAIWYITASNRMSGNSRYFDGSGTYDIDMAVDTYILSSYGGALTARLPPANATESIGRTITIKKTDPSTNPITITESGGNGPDQSTQTLSNRYNAITVFSNGGQWYVVGRY